MAKPIIIFGTGEIAELAKFYFSNDSHHEVVGFTVDDDFVSQDKFLGIPVIPISEIVSKYPSNQFDAHVALSYKNMNKLRESKFNLMKDLGYHLVSFIASSTPVWPDFKHGENCFILEKQTIQPFVSLGENVMLWSSNHIGHGSSIGNHTYLSSHVVISGHCKIGERCFFGVNATVRDFTNIGNDVLIGMMANVNKNITDGSVVLGQTSQVIESTDRRSNAIKRAL